MQRRVAFAVALLAVLGAVAAGAGTALAAKAPASLLTGIGDTAYIRGLSESEAVSGRQAVALARTRQARATLARFFVDWWYIAPDPPPSREAARDPEWGGYRWSRYDDAVRAARTAGLEPLLVIHGAPTWAEGPNRPSSAPFAVWRPSPGAYRDFAEAAARRYSGAIQPRVRYWQAWNEPNLEGNLSPQWESVNGKLRAASPATYKQLLTAFHDGVKAVAPDNFVVTAGTSPYGDPPGNQRMRPAYFWRSLLCVKGGRKPRPRSSCPGGPARFDALAHHPYPIGLPNRRAANADDVSVPDMSRLSRPLSVARKAGYVYRKRGKQLWVTELAYDSKPPDPGGYSARRMATYLEATMYLLWKQGVDAYTWFLLRDEPEGPRGWGFTRQSGLYLRGETIERDTAKPALTAFRFPFTAYRRSARKVELWGLAPQRGKVVVERRTAGGEWTVVSRPKARGNRVFVRSLAVRNGAVLRARQAGETSRSWRVVKSGP